MLSIFITSDVSKSERRFSPDITIGSLKDRLEMIVGSQPQNMSLQLYDQSDQLIGPMANDNAKLSDYPIENYMRIHVADSKGSKTIQQYVDVSNVEKFEISDEQYNTRTDSVRAFKQRNKMGRFADKPDNVDECYAEEAMKIHLKDRFKTEANKRGTVRYVGKTGFKEGWWVGVEYDEPIGRNDGTVDGEEYFRCRNKHGAFLRPDKVTVGDYPEEDLFDDEDDLAEM